MPQCLTQFLQIIHFEKDPMHDPRSGLWVFANHGGSASMLLRGTFGSVMWDRTGLRKSPSFVGAKITGGMLTKGLSRFRIATAGKAWPTFRRSSPTGENMATL